jgi:opacity protein-like surface antigen
MSKMSKFFAAVMLFAVCGTSAFANEHVMSQFMSVKDQVRLSLWYEGVNSENTKQAKVDMPQQVPVELDKPLKELDL